MKIEGLGSAGIDKAINAKQNVTDIAFEDMLKKAYTDGDKEQLKEVCKEFEGIMLNMMFKQMKKTVPEGGLFEKNIAREIFEEMLDEELMSDATQRGIGVAEVLYKQLSLNLDNMYEISNRDKLHSDKLQSEGDSVIKEDEYKTDIKDVSSSVDSLNDIDALMDKNNANIKQRTAINAYNMDNADSAINTYNLDNVSKTIDDNMNNANKAIDE
jgi:flagellar protein FlgJ